MCVDVDLDLPASLLKELLPHLNMYHLDRIEKAAHLKGKCAQTKLCFQNGKNACYVWLMQSAHSPVLSLWRHLRLDSNLLPAGALLQQNISLPCISESIFADFDVVAGSCYGNFRIDLNKEETLSLQTNE